MPKSSLNVALKGRQMTFSPPKNPGRKNSGSRCSRFPSAELLPFKNHPFKVLDDEAMTRTVESIAQYGVLAPLIARPRPGGRLRDHLRAPPSVRAAELAGLDTLPVIVRNMEDDAATII